MFRRSRHDKCEQRQGSTHHPTTLDHSSRVFCAAASASVHGAESLDLAARTNVAARVAAGAALVRSRRTREDEGTGAMDGG